MFTRRELLGVAASAATVSAWEPRAASAQALGFFATAAMAEAGFIFGLPIVMSYATMYEDAVDQRSGQFKASFNRIKHESQVVSHEDKAVVLPNNDTLRSLAWMDLRTEPVILSVPAVAENRYYSVVLRDGNFYNFGYIGTRTTGNQAGDYMVVGPDWKGETPADIKKVFRSSTEFSMALYRTQLFNPNDIENVGKVQAGYRLEPLSTKRRQAPPPSAPTVDFQWINRDSLRKNFFQHLAFALQFSPAQFVESDARASLARMGVGPGKTFNFWDLSLKAKLEIASGIKVGDHKIDRAIADATVLVNGWRMAALFGDSGFYDGNWPLRAAASKTDFYGDEPVEAVSALAEVDDGGKMLDPERHQYAMTFARDQLPPVNAFWSLTTYDRESRSLVRNPINRSLVNSSMLPTMKTDADGGLTIYIQHKSPGSDRRTNWLPAPNGPTILALRLYWPKIGPISILPIGKGTWRPPVVKRIR